MGRARRLHFLNVFAVGLLLLSEQKVEAHEEGTSQAWTLANTSGRHVFVLLGLLLAGGSYYVGLRNIWHRAGQGRAISRGRGLIFGAGLLALGAALLPPLDTTADQLVSVHMLQHLILMFIAAPALVWGAPAFVFLWLLPAASRRRVGRATRRAGRLLHPLEFLQHPFSVAGIYTGTLWLWHLPAAYEAASEVTLLHSLQHNGFFLAAVLLWWRVLAWASGTRSQQLRALGSLTSVVPAGLVLGAFIAFARTPLYSSYAVSSPAFGIDALADQQLAGLLMLMPPGLLYLGALVGVLLKMLNIENAEKGPWQRDREHRF